MDDSSQQQAAAAPDSDKSVAVDPQLSTDLVAEKAGSCFDDIGYHMYADHRYKSYPKAGSEIIKQVIVGDAKDEMNHDILDLLLTNSNMARFLSQYEAYSVEEMAVSVQYAHNTVITSGIIRTGYIQDPARTHIPTFSDTTFMYNRYDDARTSKVGEHYIYEVPCSRQKFYTASAAGFLAAKRWQSPGRIFIHQLASPIPAIQLGYLAATEKQRTQPKKVITLTARVNGYCPTVRTKTAFESLKFDMFQLAPDFGEIALKVTSAALWAQSVDGANIGFDIGEDVFKHAYTIDPMIINLQITQTEDAGDVMAISFPVSKFMIRKNKPGGDYTKPYLIEVDCTQIINLSIDLTKELSFTVSIEKPARCILLL